MPRKGPIYQSAKGQTLCSNCKSTNDFSVDFLNNYHQVFGFEKILEDLPNACKFRKHNCKTVLEQVDLDTHEEICEYREVLCPFRLCQEILPAFKLQDHLTSKHFSKEHLLKQYCQENNDSSIFSAKIHTKMMRILTKTVFGVLKSKLIRQIWCFSFMLKRIPVRNL